MRTTHIPGSYIRFVERPRKGLKTKQWEIVTRGQVSTILGCVKWFARWRAYAFFPVNQTVYEQKCLREIATFCEERTKEHKTGASLLTGVVSVLDPRANVYGCLPCPKCYDTYRWPSRPDHPQHPDSVVCDACGYVERIIATLDDKFLTK